MLLAALDWTKSDIFICFICTNSIIYNCENILIRWPCCWINECLNAFIFTEFDLILSSMFLISVGLGTCNIKDYLYWLGQCAMNMLLYLLYGNDLYQQRKEKKRLEKQTADVPKKVQKFWTECLITFLHGWTKYS